MKRKIRLILPFPPSGNHYWGTCGKKRFILPRARIYRETVAYEVYMQKGKINAVGPVKIIARFFPPDNRRRDIADNFWKQVGDTLKHAGVYKDDSQIVEITKTLHPAEKPGRLEIELEEL